MFKKGSEPRHKIMGRCSKGFERSGIVKGQSICIEGNIRVITLDSLTHLVDYLEQRPITTS